MAQRITGGHFEIRRAFRCFDRDGSGQITESEFKEMLVNYAIFVSDEVIFLSFVLIMPDDYFPKTIISKSFLQYQ